MMTKNSDREIGVLLDREGFGFGFGDSIGGRADLETVLFDFPLLLLVDVCFLAVDHGDFGNVPSLLVLRPGLTLDLWWGCPSDVVCDFVVGGTDALREQVLHFRRRTVAVARPEHFRMRPVVRRHSKGSSAARGSFWLSLDLYSLFF